MDFFAELQFWLYGRNILGYNSEQVQLQQKFTSKGKTSTQLSLCDLWFYVYFFGKNKLPSSILYQLNFYEIHDLHLTIEWFLFCLILYNWKPYFYLLHVNMYSLSYGKFMVSSLLFLSCDLLPFLTHLLFTQSGCAFSDSTPSTVEDFSAWQSSCKAVILVCTLLALQYSSFMSKWFSLLYSLLPNYISWFSFDESPNYTGWFPYREIFF